jgi:hypothetical protein
MNEKHSPELELRICLASIVRSCDCADSVEADDDVFLKGGSPMAIFSQSAATGHATSEANQANWFQSSVPPRKIRRRPTFPSNDDTTRKNKRISKKINERFSQLQRNSYPFASKPPVSSRSCPES